MICNTHSVQVLSEFISRVPVNLGRGSIQVPVNLGSIQVADDLSLPPSLWVAAAGVRRT